jgi:RNA polymerase sigma-70 factor (ECF subfamily)
MDSSSPATRVSQRRLQKLFAELRRGDGQVLAAILDLYRPYLLATAQARMDRRLKAKAGPSDLVQETLADAHRAWQRIDHKPKTDAEFREWLRMILLERLKALRRRYYGAQSRSLKRERSLDDGQSKRLIDHLAADQADSPSENFDRQALADRLEQALQRLPAAYRQVILWRNRDQKKFADIGARLDRSPDAARMLWRRAIRLLKKELGVRGGDD